MPKSGYTCITVPLHLYKTLSAEAKARNCSIARLISRLLGTSTPHKSTSTDRLNKSLNQLRGERILEKPVEVDRAGFEPATTRVRARYSYQAELPAHMNYLNELADKILSLVKDGNPNDFNFKFNEKRGGFL